MLKEFGVEERIRLVRLYDLYSGLLTGRQKKCAELYFFNDFSLSEIAVEFTVSRQAVYDLLRRVQLLLEKYERALHLDERNERSEQGLAKAAKLLRAFLASGSDIAAVVEALALIEQAGEKDRTKNGI